MTDDWKSKYDNAQASFSDGLARVKLNGKWGFVNTQGKEVIPLMYDNVDFFSEGLSRVSLGDDETGKWGFVNTQGKEVIPLKYDYAWSFHEGLAIVKLSGKKGYVDKEGHEYWDMTEDEVRRQMRNR